MNLQEIKSKYDRLVYKKVNLTIQKNKIRKQIREATKEIQDYHETKEILNQAIEITHKQFKFEIENTITNAVKQIFDRDLKFELIYEKKRGGLETRIIIKENGEELEPKDDLGGSIIDIISLCFRIILWQMSTKKTRNVFILDEPFKWTGSLAQLTGLVLKELSKKLNFQVIFITHDKSLMDIADRTFKVKNINGISKVKTIRKNIV